MSVRRVDDESGFSASSLDASISALADRLPGATRLSHVLAIGAKFKLEQQGKQQQQQLQPRKLVNTDGYDRGGRYGMQGFTYRAQNFPWFYQQYYDNPVNRMWLANAANLVNPQLQTQAMAACRDMLYNLPSYGKSKITAKDLDFLRKMDAYVLLNYIRNSTPGPPPRDPTKISDPQDPRTKTNARLHDLSTALLKESLYRDREYRDGKNNPVANLARDQLKASHMHLGQHDDLFKVRPGLLDADFGYLDQMALDEEIDAERQLELEQQQLAQLVAQGNVQPHNQQMPGPGVMHLWGNP